LERLASARCFGFIPVFRRLSIDFLAPGSIEIGRDGGGLRPDLPLGAVGCPYDSIQSCVK